MCGGSPPSPPPPPVIPEFVPETQSDLGKEGQKAPAKKKKSAAKRSLRSVKRTRAKGTGLTTNAAKPAATA